jgi:hypothetical protein
MSSSWWTDNTLSSYPDSVEVTFAGERTINEIDVFGLQQNSSSPVEPTLTMTSSYALTSFEVQYWTGSAWATVSGGSVNGNSGKYSGVNLWRNEQSAGRTQLGIGNKIGFTSAERIGLEQWIR